MRLTTIKSRIFAYNILAISMLVVLIAFIFYVSGSIYIRKEVNKQLLTIARRAAFAATQQGPRFLPRNPESPVPGQNNPPQDADVSSSYMKMNRSLREPLSIINAEFLLFDKNNTPIIVYSEDLPSNANLITKLTQEVNSSKLIAETERSFFVNGIEYIAVIQPVKLNNNLDLGSIVVFSSLEKLNQIQTVIILILFLVLFLSALIMVYFSNLISKKISAPFSSINDHIKELTGRNFGSRMITPVDDEMQEFANNINLMAEKLEEHDKAQKTFLQNVSHEFRTPLMSIQSYAEGIKHGVVDANESAEIIIVESERLTKLVSDLLYLSRLDSIEEVSHPEKLDIAELISSSMRRFDAVAKIKNINLVFNHDEDVEIVADAEKFSRAITNIIDNSLRYADTQITLTLKKSTNNSIELIIQDDGPGISDSDAKHIFERFYVGKNGNHGLGLSISKAIFEKMNGSITYINNSTEKKGVAFIIKLPTNKLY